VGLSQLFSRAYDTDGSTSMDRSEFQKMANKMGFGEVASELFTGLDVNKSGHITVDELCDRARRTAGTASPLVVEAETDFVQHLARHETHARQLKTSAQTRTVHSAPLVAYQKIAAIEQAAALGLDVESALEGFRVALSAALAQQGTHVLALFGEMDRDGDHRVQRREVDSALRHLLQLDALPTTVLDAIFDKLDDDGSGTIRFAEMAAWLPPTAQRAPPAKRTPSVVGREAPTLTTPTPADLATARHRPPTAAPSSPHSTTPHRPPPGLVRRQAPPDPRSSRFHPCVAPVSPRHTSTAWFYVLAVPEADPLPAHADASTAMTHRQSLHGGIVIEVGGRSALPTSRGRRPHKWTTFSLNNMWGIRPGAGRDLAMDGPVRVWRDAPLRKKPVMR
jgi:Ca2+-binding EF-hand superfamily protein